MKNSLIQRSRDEAQRKEKVFELISNKAHKAYANLELNYTEETYEFDEALSEHFQRGELCSEYSFEEMLEALLAKAYNTYRMRKNVQGLMLLDHSKEDAERIIKEYDDKKRAEFDKFFRNHSEKIEYWKAKLRFRYANLKQDSEGSKGELDAPKFFSDVVKDAEGYIPFVTTPNFPQSMTFYNFVMQKWDRVSITGGRRAMSVIRQFNRNGRLKVASILQHFIGR